MGNKNKNWLQINQRQILSCWREPPPEQVNAFEIVAMALIANETNGKCHIEARPLDEELPFGTD